MEHHAYVVAGEVEEGLARSRVHIEKELGMKLAQNPDVIVLKYGLLSVEDVRKIIALAQQGPIAGDKKAIVISASRIYHEAQNALLKLFEEPALGTTLYLVVPSIGMLLPTLRSRVQVLMQGSKIAGYESAHAFLKMNTEKRSAFIKRLASGKDEDERRENRDEALAIINGVEYATYEKGIEKDPQFLRDVSILRAYLHERSAPVRMILEHLSLTLPKNLQ